ncbi:hypothetical protein phiOC_p376 [Ochrobactrum phage vB_OspM_OC]|nr:hypothetical protein phiOC_p376 [Ochrobactrum phage vB_OspM_OC]
MSSVACYAIVPSLQPHHGDPRRCMEPYFTTLSLSYGDLNIANWGMKVLNKMGHKCHLVVMDDKGIV